MKKKIFLLGVLCLAVPAVINAFVFGFGFDDGPMRPRLDAPATDATFPVERSYSFDGANDYVTMANTGIPTGDASRSVSFWHRPTDVTTATAMAAISWGNAGIGNQFSLYRLASSPALMTVWRGGGGVTGAKTLVVNTWYHIVITYDSTASELYTYFNKVVDVNGTNPGNYTTAADGSFRIGIEQGAVNEDSANIADVKIFDRVLTTAEISDLYDMKIVDNGLVFWGKCAEGSGLVCVDEYGNDGTITTDDAATFHSTEKP